MKAIEKLIAGILIPGIAIFISCTKNPTQIVSPPAPIQYLDSLSGREFEFNDITWREIVSWGTNVIVEIDRPDLFFNPFRELKVTMRLDTSSVWLNVFQDHGSYLAGFNFYYTIGWYDYFYAVSGRLYIYPVPQNLSLNGRKVSIKVKFL